MNNLASSYSDLGQRQEAPELEGEAISEEHPNALLSMSNFAIISPSHRS
jgi:hypothetical protein